MWKEEGKKTKSEAIVLQATLSPRDYSVWLQSWDHFQNLRAAAGAEIVFLKLPGIRLERRMQGQLVNLTEQ